MQVITRARGCMATANVKAEDLDPTDSNTEIGKVLTCCLRNICLHQTPTLGRQHSSIHNTNTYG